MGSEEAAASFALEAGEQQLPLTVQGYLAALASVRSPAALNAAGRGIGHVHASHNINKHSQPQAPLSSERA